MSTIGSTGGAAPASTGMSMASTGAPASTGAAPASTGASMGSTGTGQQGSTFTSSAGSTATVAFKWGDGWREQLAAGDAKILQRLGRFNSPEDVWRSYTALEARLSSGELRSALKPDATPEEVAAWRKENGVPETPAAYDLKFENGLTIGEDDKPVIDKFLEVAHQNNMPNAAVKEAIAWYYKTAQDQTAARAEEDVRIAGETQEALRAKWGAEYKMNMNAATALLDAGPKGLREQLLNGRLADGTPIGSSPAALEWLASMSRQLNPAATVVPAGTANAAQAIETELAALTALMGNRNSSYWKGPQAEQKQKRYRELVTAKQALDRQAGPK